MNTKLYDKELQVKEMSVAQFDAIEGTHTFSEKYENKKSVVLETFRQKTPKSMNKAMKVAVAALAVIICSGTALATNGTYLREFYESRINGIDEKYVDLDFIEGKYDLPVEVTTDDESGLLDFQVLQMDKSEHTISVAVLVTVNHPDSFDEALFYDVSWDLEIVGMEDVLWETGLGWNLDCYREEMAQTLGMGKNQFVFFQKYRYDDSVDLTQAEKIKMKCKYVHYWKEDSAEPDSTMLVPIDEEHEWEMIMAVQQQYSDDVVELNRSFQLGEREFYIQKMRLSPTGLGFVYEAFEDSTMEPSDTISTTAYIYNYEQECKLVMSDGHKIAISQIAEGSAGYVEDVDKNYLYDEFSFGVPIDTEQIVGVEIAGELIEIK